MKRAALWIVLAIGGALVVVPLATGMFGKATAGQHMMRDFVPIMAPASVDRTARYLAGFDGIGRDFAPMMTARNVTAFQGYLEGINAMRSDMNEFMGGFARQMHMTPTQVNAMMAKRYPSLSAMLAAMPQMQRAMGGMVGTMSRNVAGFAGVGAALAYFHRMVGVMQANVDEFAKANALPSMGLLPWFFVVPGIVLILLSAILLIAGRPSALPVPRGVTPATEH